MARSRNRTETGDNGGTQFGLSLGGLLSGFGKLVEAISQAAEKGEVLGREGNFRVPLGGPGRKEVKGVYGFTIRTLAGSKPIIRRFGNVKETPQGAVVDEVREPLVDVFEEKDRVRLVAELAGCEEKDIQTEIHGDIVRISANTGSRKYLAEVLLPRPVDEKSLERSFRNGVLEIALCRKK